MGGRAWCYEIECDGAVEQAISELHQLVLGSAELVELIGEPADALEFAGDVLSMVESSGMFSPEVAAELSEAIAAQEGLDRYISVDVVRLLTAERLGSGTILDVDTAVRASEDLVVEMAGLIDPSADQIREAQDEFPWLGIEPGSSVFVPAAGSSHVFFFGLTGG